MICNTLNDLYCVEWFELRWMIYTTLNNLYSVEWFVLRWTICSTLNGLYYIERFALGLMICTTLKDLYNVEWISLRWKICTTLNDLYFVEWILLRWKICTTLSDLHSVERFQLRWMIRSTMDDLYNVESFGLYWLLSFSFLMNVRCTFSRKYCKIFGNIKRKYSTLLQKLVIKRCFWKEHDRFWRLFHLWQSFYESPMSGIRHSHQTVPEHNKQPLNLIRLIREGKIQSCFVNLKRYFSLSKLIQSLFKSVFI